MICSVLVADDDEEDFLLLSNHIQKCHQHVSLTYVSSGEEVINTLKSTPLPAFVILNARMPFMNSYETIRSIRAKPEWQHIPILIWSGSISNSDVILFHQAGANSVVLKQSLLEQIDTFCTYWLGLVELPENN